MSRVTLPESCQSLGLNVGLWNKGRKRSRAINFVAGIKASFPACLSSHPKLQQAKASSPPSPSSALCRAVLVKLRGGLAPPGGYMESGSPLPWLGALLRVSHRHAYAPLLTWKILFKPFHPQKGLRVLKGGGDFRAEECKGRAVDRVPGISGG